MGNVIEIVMLAAIAFTAMIGLASYINPPDDR